MLKERKQRSDKKKEVKPTIQTELFEIISRISYITNTPLKTVAETILQKCFHSTTVADQLSSNFVRDYWIGQTLYVGNHDFTARRTISISGSKTRRISLRLNASDQNELSKVAYSLNLTLTSASALLLDIAIYETNFIHEYVFNYVDSTLDDKRKAQLKLLISSIHEQLEPGQSSGLTLMLNRIVESAGNTVAAIESFLDSKIK